MNVLMPQLGETVAEGKIVKWFKQAGDTVAAGDNLFEIETDKTSMEVPAIETGVLAEIRVAAGAVAPVGAVVAVIGAAGAAVVATKPQAAATPKATPPSVAASAPRQPEAARQSLIALEPFFEVRTPGRNYGPARLADGGTVTPLARRLAFEAGIDLARVSPSGPHGRILARDIGTVIAGGAGVAPAMRAPAQPPAAQLSSDMIKALYAPGSYQEVPVDGMRRTIAARLSEAKSTIPHFYLTTEFELDALLHIREQANEKGKKGSDGKPLYRLSVNDFLIKALAAAMQRVPAANAAWAEDRILYFNSSDVSVAVSIDGGLITPVVRNAEKKSVVMLSQEVRDLAARSKAKKLKPEEYQGGGTTISNLGMFGVSSFSAIINPPQATIFAIGAAERRAVEAKGRTIQFATKLTVTLSCDHRVVDGALGAELLATFKSFVEQPVTALV